MGNLFLSRRQNQSVFISNDIQLKVTGFYTLHNVQYVKFSINAPDDVKIVRDDAVVKTKKDRGI